MLTIHYYKNIFVNINILEIHVLFKYLIIVKHLL